MSGKAKSIGSVLATLLLGIIVLELVILPFINVLGGFTGIVTEFIGLVPFGEVIGEFAHGILSATLGQGGQIQPIQQNVITVSYVFQELAKSLFTIIIYETLCLLVLRPMGLSVDYKDNSGADKIKWWIVKVIMAIIAAALAPLLMKWTFANMATLTSGWKIFISGLISTILTGGGIAFFMFFLGISIAKAILYVVLKFIVVGGLRLFGCYTFLMLALLGLQNGILSWVVYSVPVIMVIIMLLTGVEIMLESIVKKK